MAQATQKTIEEVRALRTKSMTNGYAPVAIANAVEGVKKSGKNPISDDWYTKARLNQLEISAEGKNAEWIYTVSSSALNTGILASDLRVFDIDIDDSVLAEKVAKYIEDIFGKTITRFRANSSRVMMVYRTASDGEPRKVTVGASGCEVEVLGEGNQFVAFGGHWTGVQHQWRNGSPETNHVNSLPRVKEADVLTVLEAIGDMIGHPVDKTPVEPVKAAQIIGGGDYPPKSAEDVREALARINVYGLGYEEWRNVCAACYNSNGDFSDFDDWSRGDGNKYDRLAARNQWNASANLNINFGYLVNQARKSDPNYLVPISKQTDASLIPSQTPVRVANGKYKARNVKNSFTWKKPKIWKIEDIISDETVTMFYAASGVMKTFFLLDMLLHVAHGKPNFCGKKIRTNGGVVYYVAAEDASGVNERVCAWGAINGVDVEKPGNFHLHPKPIDLASKDAEGDLAEFLADIRADVADGITYEFFVFDTLSRSTQDDLNDNSIATGILNTLCELRDITGACVIFVHHTGKDLSKGAMGSKGLYNASDCVIHMSKQSEDGRKIYVEKNKNQKDGYGIEFEVEQKEIRDSFNEVRTGIKFVSKSNNEFQAVQADFLKVAAYVTEHGSCSPTVALELRGQSDNKCNREKLFSEFNGCSPVSYEGAVLQLIEDGKRRKFVLIEDVRSA
jgi:hypothetical protein